MTTVRPCERPSPTISVILPTHNGAAHIEEQLAALSRQVCDEAWEVIIVDNRSTDSTPELIDKWLPRFGVDSRVVRADDRLGQSYARNVGVSFARGRDVLFVDDDDRVGPGWLAAMANCLRTHELVGSSFDYSALNETQAAQPRGSFQSHELGVLFGVPVVSGGGAGCRAELWRQLGGSSLTFSHAAEDLDFSIRALLDGGITPVLCEHARYEVRLRSTPRASFEQGFRFAIATVGLYSEHSARLGAQPESSLRLARRWIGLVVRLPEVRTPGGRLKWTWQLGTRLGRLVGSLQHRVWYP